MIDLLGSIPRGLRYHIAEDRGKNVVYMGFIYLEKANDSVKRGGL